MMTSEETMDLLSHVRLGVNLSLIEEVTIPTVNELFIHTQPAHLQKLMGSLLDGEERNAARARYLRTRLREADAHPN
jgi:protein arginine kinase